MARNGSGVYSLPTYLAVTGETILAARHNTPLEDLGAEITASLPRAGTAAMTGALNMGSNLITSVTDPTSAQHAATKAYVDAMAYLDGDKGDLTIASSGTAFTINASSVEKSMIENLADYKVLGNVSGGAAAPAEVAVLDEDDMVSDSATSLVTQQSSKAYADAISANNVWTYINEYALSGETAPYEITGLSGWDAIVFEIMLKPSLDGDLYIQLGHGTTTWLTGSVYRWLARGGRINSGGSVNDTTVGDWSDTQIDLTTLSAEATGDVPFIATVQFQNWSAVTYNRMCKFQSVYLASSPEFVTVEGGGELQDTTNALTAIRFGNSGGGTLSGTILAYGRNFA